MDKDKTYTKETHGPRVESFNSAIITTTTTLRRQKEGPERQKGPSSGNVCLIFGPRWGGSKSIPR